MPGPIAELAGQFLTDPERVAVAPPSTTAERVEQAVIHIDNAKKQDLLHALLKDKGISRALVFARTKHGANRIVTKLIDAGFSADAIHGNKSQGQRERALEAFKKGKARLLVATEIAARGIDVDEVTHVINFDLPNVPEQYVHRIGRTARAGHTGLAISFCAPDERAYLKDIQRLTKQDVPVMKTDFSLATPGPDDRTPRPKPQGRGGRPQTQKRPPRHRSEGRSEERTDRSQQPRPAQDRKHAPKKHHASDAHGHAHAKQDGRAASHVRDGEGRDRGDRRDRKGNDVWSNSGPPRRLNRKPQRV
jgi:ATP-dependent RNA helicase RhlE